MRYGDALWCAEDGSDHSNLVLGDTLICVPNYGDQAMVGAFGRAVLKAIYERENQ